MPAKRLSGGESMLSAQRLSITLDQVLSETGPRKAFDKLCSMGADSAQLKRWVMSAIHFTGFRQDDPLFVPGLSRQSLAKLPDDIRAIARKVASVGGNPNLYSSPAAYEPVRKLVENLNRFAGDLEKQVRFYRSFLQKHPRYYDMQTVSRRRLLRYVHRSTGQPQYTLVAEVLSGAPKIENEEPFVDASSLRKLYSNSSRSRLRLRREHSWPQPPKGNIPPQISAGLRLREWLAVPNNHKP